MKSGTFTIVIVTYNRLHLLKECIECALNQTLTANHIVVVDNASNDGTDEYLRNVVEGNNEKIIVIREENNIGGSGGFHDGMVEAMKLEDEWILLIDDDAMLDKDYLRLIYEQFIINRNVLAYSGTVMTDGQVIIEHRKRMTYGFKGGEKSVGESEYNSDTFEYNLSSFCGLVINRQIVSNVGAPYKNFFIWYDDTEYCIRFRKLTKIINVNTAVLNHKTSTAIIDNEENRRYFWKRYYGFRNLIAALLINKCYALAIKKTVVQMRDGIKSILDDAITKDVSLYNMRVRIDGMKDAYLGRMGRNPKYLPEEN